jgi:hypothetical protein
MIFVCVRYVQYYTIRKGFCQFLLSKKCVKNPTENVLFEKPDPRVFRRNYFEICRKTECFFGVYSHKIQKIEKVLYK